MTEVLSSDSLTQSSVGPAFEAAFAGRHEAERDGNLPASRPDRRSAWHLYAVELTENARVLSLPLFPAMTHAEQDRVAQTLSQRIA